MLPLRNDVIRAEVGTNRATGHPHNLSAVKTAERRCTCVKQLKLPLPIPEGYEVVFRPWITLKNGKKLFASQVGKRAFPLVVPVKR